MTRIAQRLAYVHFDMTNLNASEFSLVQKLPNVKKMSFYNCDGITTLLGYAANMPSVTEIHFDYIRPSDELLKRLSSIPNLKKLIFNDADKGDLDLFKRALPNVKVEIYDESQESISSPSGSANTGVPKAFVVSRSDYRMLQCSILSNASNSRRLPLKAATIVKRTALHSPCRPPSLPNEYGGDRNVSTAIYYLLTPSATGYASAELVSSVQRFGYLVDLQTIKEQDRAAFNDLGKHRGLFVNSNYWTIESTLETARPRQKFTGKARGTRLGWNRYSTRLVGSGIGSPSSSIPF